MKPTKPPQLNDAICRRIHAILAFIVSIILFFVISDGKEPVASKFLSILLLWVVSLPFMIDLAERITLRYFPSAASSNAARNTPQG